MLLRGVRLSLLASGETVIAQNKLVCLVIILAFRETIYWERLVGNSESKVGFLELFCAIITNKGLDLGILPWPRRNDRDALLPWGELWWRCASPEMHLPGGMCLSLSVVGGRFLGCGYIGWLFLNGRTPDNCFLVLSVQMLSLLLLPL